MTDLSPTISTESYAVVRHRGREAIKDVLREHGITAEAFFHRSMRTKYVTAARCEAAKRLKALNYSLADMCRLLKRNHSTVLNYLNSDYRTRKRARHADVWIKRRVLQILRPEIREIVVAIAEAESTTPETIISEWIAERASYEAAAKEAA